MKKEQIQSLAIAGVLCALIGAMTAIPQTGYISYGVIAITTLHIPVIIGAILLGPWWGTAIGAFWGVTCLIRAFVMPVELVDPLFRNPLISVLPRLLVGLVAGFVYQGLKKALGEKGTKISFYITGAAGAITNTGLVLGLLFLFSENTAKYFGGSFVNVVKVVLTVNGALEILAAPVLIAAAATAVFALLKRKA